MISSACGSFKIGLKKEYDCQCGFCKKHKCFLNYDETKCIHPLCERNIITGDDLK